MSRPYDVPQEVVQFWCLECGLKQWRTPKRRHKIYGKWCEGEVTKATYVLAKKEMI